MSQGSKNHGKIRPRASLAGISSLSVAVLTVSDTRTLETDASGALIVALAMEAGHQVVSREDRAG